MARTAAKDFLKKTRVIREHPPALICSCAVADERQPKEGLAIKAGSSGGRPPDELPSLCLGISPCAAPRGEPEDEVRTMTQRTARIGRRMLKLSQFADETGWSEITLRRRIKDGLLRAVKQRRRWYILREDAEAFYAQLRMHRDDRVD